ncbi:hypothetical protein [Leifsonia shinshuensis]|uniref:Uncharacterized protein n=1 Tax=Leifsonia shinshuensis TaxID=150026 RepID=A0A7G6Y9R0_9MICO|nr:hypothetical protein [Leifsonia shinshuensis]QNE35225.1 hypothetical protein F1C12_08810 [Leifsonia shinshuensis]
MMVSNTERLASRLLESARVHEQASHRIAPTDDIEAVRAQIRRSAREAGIRIRTGIVDGALVVVRADAALWHEPTSVMRAKLTPGD